MTIDIISIFPWMFEGPFRESRIRRALEREVVRIWVHDLRDFAEGKHKQVDDTPEAARAADTITAAECGKTFFVSGDGYTLTLPAISGVSAGCAFRFIVSGAPTTSTVVLTGNTDEDVLIGGINELEVDTSDDGPYDASADTITFVGGTAVVGDFVYMISNGTMFYVSGQANADGGVTITDSD